MWNTNFQRDNLQINFVCSAGTLQLHPLPEIFTFVKISKESIITVRGTF